MARHIEQPGSRHSKPDFRKILSSPSCSACSLTRPEPGTIIALTLVSGGDSPVIYDRFRETGESSLLNDLRDYNRDDCLSTLLLRDWLIDRAKEAGHWPPAAEVAAEPFVEKPTIKDDAQIARE